MWCNTRSGIQEPVAISRLWIQGELAAVRPAATPTRARWPHHGSCLATPSAAPSNSRWTPPRHSPPPEQKVCPRAWRF